MSKISLQESGVDDRVGTMGRRTLKDKSSWVLTGSLIRPEYLDRRMPVRLSLIHAGILFPHGSKPRNVSYTNLRPHRRVHKKSQE